MSNFCIDCKHSRDITKGWVYEHCAHPYNISQPDEIYGKTSIIRSLRDARQYMCKGELYEDKPAEKPWWKLWN